MCFGCEIIARSKLLSLSSAPRRDRRSLGLLLLIADFLGKFTKVAFEVRMISLSGANYAWIAFSTDLVVLFSLKICEASRTLAFS